MGKVKPRRATGDTRTPKVPIPADSLFILRNVSDRSFYCRNCLELFTTKSTNQTHFPRAAQLASVETVDRVRAAIALAAIADPDAVNHEATRRQTIEQIERLAAADLPKRLCERLADPEHVRKCRRLPVPFRVSPVTGLLHAGRPLARPRCPAQLYPLRRPLCPRKRRCIKLRPLRSPVRV